MKKIKTKNKIKNLIKFKIILNKKINYKQNQYLKKKII